ncbi:MAG TPA: ATP-binding protein [Steroidobacteraceae bacterium]
MESSLTDLDHDRAAAQHELTVHQEQLRIQNDHLQEAQHSLEVSRDRYADLYDFAPIAYVTLSSEGLIEEANLTAVALLGSDREHALGRPFRLFVTPQDRSQFDLHLIKCRKGFPNVSTEILLLRSGAAPVPTMMRSERSVSGPDSSIHVYRTAITDLSELRRLEQERQLAALRAHSAQMQAQMQDRLIAMVSHELRTPLSAILLWSNILRIKLGDNAEHRRALEGITRSAESQRQLIDDLLDTSRISAGKLRLEKQRIDLRKVLTGAIDTLLPAAESKRISLRVELDPEIAWAEADPNRLRQILTNLIGNAVKFTLPGGSVSVEMFRTGVDTVVRVSDTGKGIDAAFLQQIFQPFSQAEETISSREHGGLGLGLTISRQLAQLHGGAIEASSDGVGHGATFTVRLPLPMLADENAGESGNGAGEPNRSPARVVDEFGGLSGLHVLLVEDEPDTRLALQTLVREAGAEVIAVDTASAAFDAFQQARPDLLMGDIGIPGEDGYSLIQRLRALERTDGSRPVPAVALTAFTRTGDRERALAAGFDSHLSKPIEPKLLFATLRTLAGRS